MVDTTWISPALDIVQARVAGELDDMVEYDSLPSVIELGKHKLQLQRLYGMCTEYKEDVERHGRHVTEIEVDIWRDGDVLVDIDNMRVNDTGRRQFRFPVKRKVFNDVLLKVLMRVDVHLENYVEARVNHEDLKITFDSLPNVINAAGTMYDEVMSTRSMRAYRERGYGPDKGVVINFTDDGSVRAAIDLVLVAVLEHGESLKFPMSASKFNDVMDRMGQRIKQRIAHEGRG
jgi:hypothetical protein